MANEFYSFQGPAKKTAPAPIIAQRDPTGDDTGYELGQTWVDTVDNEAWVLTSVSGSANWEPVGSGLLQVATLTGDTGGAISPTAGNINLVSGNDGLTVAGSGSTLTFTDEASLSPYVVGTGARFSTIQDAVDQTIGDGVATATIFVLPGQYTEDVDFTGATNIGIWGAHPLGNEGQVEIVGTAVPPTAATNVIIRNCLLTDAGAIFSDAGAGAANLTLIDCEIAVTSGHCFDVDAWTGTLAAYQCTTSSTNDGFVTNATGGAAVIVSHSEVGNGTGSAMATTGVVTIEGSVLGCSWAAATGTVVTAANSTFDETITLSNDTAGSFRGCQLVGGASAALTMSSTGAVEVSNCVISSSNDPAIDGAGAGVLSIGDNTFVDNALLAATLTLAELDTVLSPVMNNTVILRGRNAAGTGNVGIVAVNASDLIDIDVANVGVGIGLDGASAGIPLSLSDTTAATNNSNTNMQNWVLHSSGTVAAGFGMRTFFTLDDDAGTETTAGQMRWEWSDPTDGSETSIGSFFTNTAGSVAEALRWSGSGISTDTGTTNMDFVAADHTPTVSGDSAAGAGTYSVQVGSYITTGAAGDPEAFCIFNFNLAWSAHTGTGDLLLDLPVAADATAGLTPPCALLVDGLTVTANSQPYAETVAGTSTAAIVDVASGTKAAVAMDTAVTQFCGTLIYKI